MDADVEMQAGGKLLRCCCAELVNITTDTLVKAMLIFDCEGEDACIVCFSRQSYHFEGAS